MFSDEVSTSNPKRLYIEWVDFWRPCGGCSDAYFRRPKENLAKALSEKYLIVDRLEDAEAIVRSPFGQEFRHHGIRYQEKTVTIRDATTDVIVESATASFEITRSLRKTRKNAFEAARVAAGELGAPRDRGADR